MSQYVYGMDKVSNLILLYVHTQLSQYHVLKNCFFPLNWYGTLATNRKCNGLFLEPQLYSTDLYVYSFFKNLFGCAGS